MTERVFSFWAVEGASDGTNEGSSAGFTERDGVDVGLLVGCSDGLIDGISDGFIVGKDDGCTDKDGDVVGVSVSCNDGVVVGISVGVSVGKKEGLKDGLDDGVLDGEAVVGNRVGCAVVGAMEGDKLTVGGSV